MCYEAGLKTDPALTGKLIVDFTIERDGAVSGAKTSGDLPEQGVAGCVKKSFETLSFPAPEGASRVAVKVPLSFAPGDSGAKAASASEPAPKSPETIDGKALEDVTALEIERALRALGATDISSTTVPSHPGAVVFTATRAGKIFTLTFVPSGGAALSTEERARLRKSGALFERGAFALAVESDDPTASHSLLDSLIRKT
jgi:hypothetical protein